MKFEERLAQTQSKLDDLKAKINNSIDSAKDAHQADKKEALVTLAKMNASIEDFGRDVEAQVYCDFSSMKAEAKADADAIGAALDDIDAKLDAKTDKMEKDLDNFDAKVDAKAKKMDKALDDFDAKVDAKVDDQIATVEGDINATEEDFRLAKERYNSKLNSTRLKVQMHLENVKNKLDNKKTELDKAAQEELIMDLLDYADDCQMIAYAYAMEAELAILDACNEIEDYAAKYGEDA